MKYKYFIYLFSLLCMTMLSGCTRRHRTEYNHNQKQKPPKHYDKNDNYKTKSVVKMERLNGVYYVECKINGSEMQFIFDTGASDITMSLTEARFLHKQGKLSDEDFKGRQQYQIADGSISEGTIVNLKTVTIGNRTLNNVQASIVQNMEAPLLLGQSALSEFGKISIDYKNQTITFE